MKNAAVLIISIMMLLVTVVFTLQNVQVIKVNCFFWSVESSLSLVLFITVGLGILAAIVGLLPIIFSLRAAKKNLKLEVEEIREQIPKKEFPTVG
jgi:uncharacterized integral membrane protein